MFSDMARPRLRVKREHEIKFRCTALEKKTVEKKAQHSGLNVAEFVRNSALDQPISYKLTADEIEIYKMLTQYRNNFKHIGNLFREKSDIKNEVLELVAEIDRHIKKFL